jgi:hypothetical protein
LLTGKGSDRRRRPRHRATLAPLQQLLELPLGGVYRALFHAVNSWHLMAAIRRDRPLVGTYLRKRDILFARTAARAQMEQIKQAKATQQRGLEGATNGN